MSREFQSFKNSNLRGSLMTSGYNIDKTISKLTARTKYTTVFQKNLIGY